jgi:hypothetical protein
VKSVALRVWKKPTKRSFSAAIGKSSAFCFKMHFPCRIPHQNINEIFLVCNFFAKNADIVKDVLTSCDSTLDNHISGILVSGLASSAVDRGFEPWWCQTREYKIGMCCFSAKHAALRSKSKDWLARNQNNVSKWSDMSTRGLSFQWASTLKNHLSVLV